MPLSVNWDADLAHAINDLPSTVTLGGSDYSAVVDDLSTGQNAELDGIFPEADVLVHLRTSEVGTVSVGSKLTYSGKEYRVVKVETTPEGAETRLICEEVSA